MTTLTLRKGLIFAISASCLPVILFSGVIYLKQFDFNDENALDKWQSMILNGKVEYRLIEEGANRYVEASSSGACSALYYRVGYKLRENPLLSWRWKVIKFPDKTGIHDPRLDDDYAARVYVIFPFLNFSSSKFIEYVWDEHLPVGTISDSPKGSNIKRIVAHSGSSGDDGWSSETRNVYEDYFAAFGKEPRLNAGAIAIMCNADNSKSEAESGFDDIAIGSEGG